MVPPTNRNLKALRVASFIGVQPTLNFSGSIPLGSTFTFSGGTPESTYTRRTYSDGTQASSTRPSCCTQSEGSAPNSQGWMSTQAPVAGASQLGGQAWRIVSCVCRAGCG